MKKKYILFNKSIPADNLVEEENKIILFTYRFGFKNILNTEYISDEGWGCMLRSGEMIYAEAIQRHIKNRNKTIDFFIDHPSKMLSIENIENEAIKEFNLQAGHFYSPNRIICCIENLLNEAKEIPSLLSETLFSDRFITFQNSVLLMTGKELDKNLDKNILIDTQEENTYNSLVLFIVCSLGLEDIEQQYWKTLIKIFKYHNCIGMIGGEGNRGYYFIGLDEDEENLLYLDPHCVNKHDDAQIDYNSYSEENVRLLNKCNLSGSIGLGFYLKDGKDLNDFWQFLSNLNSEESFFMTVEKTETLDENEFEVHEEDDYFIIE